MDGGEAKTFIRKRLKEKYDRRDLPVIEGIASFFRKGKINPEFAEKVIDTLKNANRWQVRKTAFETGHELFEDEKYLDQAKDDPSKKIKEWATDLR